MPGPNLANFIANIKETSVTGETENMNAYVKCNRKILRNARLIVIVYSCRKIFQKRMRLFL